MLTRSLGFCHCKRQDVRQTPAAGQYFDVKWGYHGKVNLESGV